MLDEDSICTYRLMQLWSQPDLVVASTGRGKGDRGVPSGKSQRERRHPLLRPQDRCRSSILPFQFSAGEVEGLTGPMPTDRDGRRRRRSHLKWRRRCTRLDLPDLNRALLNQPELVEESWALHGR